MECPPTLRAFVDALIGLAGYRASQPDWFYATDEDIARRAIRCKKWVQLQRKEFTKWQRRLNLGLIDIEDNRYQDGERIPHRYRVKVALYAAEITQDARVSEYWNRHQFDRAFEEAARLLLDSVLAPAIHIGHKHLSRPSAEKSMERDLENHAVVHDAEAEEISRKLQRINAKQFITIPEFCFLFNCSAGYIGKLLERAQKQETAYPVPHLNLDGLIQFDREEVLKWAATIKPLGKRQRKTGGKRRPSHLREVVSR